MQFTYIVCNETEILDRVTRQVLGRIRRPRWYGDFWRAQVDGGIIEEPTQAQLRVAIQKRLDRAQQDGPVRAASRDLADIDAPAVPRRPERHSEPDPPQSPDPMSFRSPEGRQLSPFRYTRRVKVMAERATPSTVQLRRD